MKLIISWLKLSFLLPILFMILLLSTVVPIRADFSPADMPYSPTASISPPPPDSSSVSSAAGSLLLEMADSSISVGIDESGQISETLSGSMPDDSFSLSIDHGTQVLIDDDEIADPGPESRLRDLVPQKISVETVSDYPEFPEGWAQVSSVYNIYGSKNGRRHGIKMDRSALLLIHYDQDRLPDILDGLATFFYDKTTGWTASAIPPGFIAEAGQLASETDHFSLFVVLAKSRAVKPPANIVVQKMIVNPPRIALGQSSEVRMKVTNKGGLPGEYNVVFKMGDMIQKSQVVYLEAGQTTEVAVVVTPEQYGLYSLSAGTVLGSLIVDTGNGTTAPVTDYWWLIYIALGMSALAFFVFSRRFIRKK